MRKKSLWCVFLSIIMIVLLCPCQVFAEESIPEDKTLSYDEYFKNEHGFYSDTVTKSKQYLNMMINAFTPLVNKEANGKITYSGKEVSGIIGNSELVFFSVNHTIYRYHVKSRRVDRMFSEPAMESFYPITSHMIMWKRASSNDNIAARLNKEISSNGTYFVYDAITNESERIDDPDRYIWLVDGGGYVNYLPSPNTRATEFNSYYTTINGTAIPLPGYDIGDVYNGSHNGSSQCRGFSWMVYREIWGSYSHGTTRLSGQTMGSADTLYNFIALYGPGARWNFNSQYHSMIITKVYSGYIEVYHANWPSNGTVAVTRFSKSEFFDRYKVVQHVQDPRS